METRLLHAMNRHNLINPLAFHSLINLGFSSSTLYNILRSLFVQARSLFNAFCTIRNDHKKCALFGAAGIVD